MLLHIGVDVNLANCEIHGPNPPHLSRVDPKVILGRRAETDVLKKVGHRLRNARHSHAVGGQRDPATVLSFNDSANIKVDTTVGAHPEIVDAPHSPRQPAYCAALKRDVDTNPLRRYLFFALKDRSQAHSVVRHSRDLKIVFVDLLASH